MFSINEIKPAKRVFRELVFFILLPLFCFLENTALAQDSTPLDLLEKDGQKKLTSDNISNSADDGEISIEQAFDKVLSVKDKGSVDGAYKELPEKPVQKIQETEFNIDSSSNLVPKKSPSSVSKDNSKDSNVSNNLHSEKSKNLVSSSNAYGKAKIGRRKISDVGLAAIGVGELNSDNGNLNSLIWRGTSADKTVFLLERASVASRSVALTRLAYRAVARQTVPPSGANLVAADLVLARLSFLANGGRSGDLALLAEQLPDGEKWHDWRRWLVEHHLMIRNDSAACKIVSRKIKVSLDPFWHKANVICQAVQGNIGAARFAADILAASGFKDPIFFGLVDEVFNDAKPQPIDPSQLDSMHIVLMDVANRAIPLEGLEVLPKQMAETVLRLKFLDPDARLVSTFDGLTRGLINHSQAGKLWRSANVVSDDPQIALARLDGNADALTTALAWRSLAQNTSEKRFEWIEMAVSAEVASGNGAVMLPLYSELVREYLDEREKLSDVNSGSSKIGSKIALLLAITRPNDTKISKIFEEFNEAGLAAKLLRSVEGKELSMSEINDLEIWHILPILESIGLGLESKPWLELSREARLENHSFVNLTPVLLRAVVDAANDRRIGETILLANWLFQDVALDQISPTDAAIVIRALKKIGQEETAKNLVTEILSAHLMKRLINRTPDDARS